MIITGAVYISQLLKVTHTLQVLDMGYNNISDDGIAVISEALQHNKSLTTLLVAQCRLSVKGTVVCIRCSTMHTKCFDAENFLAEAIMYCTQQTIQGEIFHDWLKTV